MTANANRLYQAALALDEPERAELAGKLLESIDAVDEADWAEAWDAEIAKRIADLEQGKVQTIPWSEVRRKMLGERP